MMNRVRQGDYKISALGINNDKFVLEYRDGTRTQIQVQENDDGTVEYVGLPDKFAYELNKFDDKEKLSNPKIILESIISSSVVNNGNTPGNQDDYD